MLVYCAIIAGLMTSLSCRNSNVIRNEGGLRVLVSLIGEGVDSSVKEEAVRCVEVLVQNAR